MNISSMITQARADGIITRAELIDIINVSTDNRELQQAVVPFLDSFDPTAKQTWEALFGVGGTGTLKPTPDGGQGPYFEPGAPQLVNGDLAQGQPGKPLTV